jgi:acetyl-CoA synthetase
MSYSAFVQARDFLLAHRTDYETAYRDFQWPQLTNSTGHWIISM